MRVSTILLNVSMTTVFVYVLNRTGITQEYDRMHFLFAVYSLQYPLLIRWIGDFYFGSTASAR